VANRYEHFSSALLNRDSAALLAPQRPAPELTWPTDLGPDLYHLADIRVWLDGLREDLGRVTGSPSVGDDRDLAGLRVRVAGVADGSPG
jgi:hypothetical protein